MRENLKSDSQISPPYIYGTAWKGEETTALTLTALRAGFRALDTANQAKYYNEAAVGDAISLFCEAGQSKREDLFIQTKFTWGRDHNEVIPYDLAAPCGEQVEQSFASSLAHLHLDYIDSYLLHTPFNTLALSPQDVAVWRAMEGLIATGRVKHLGGSNIRFKISHQDALRQSPLTNSRCFYVKLCLRHK